jgi:hypothetical protein
MSCDFAAPWLWQTSVKLDNNLAKMIATSNLLT